MGGILSLATTLLPIAAWIITSKRREKRLKAIGQIEVPQEAFLAVLKI